MTTIGHLRVPTNGEVVTIMPVLSGRLRTNVANALIESSLNLEEYVEARPNGGGWLLALVDSLQGGTLSVDQREMVHALRTGILALVTQEPQVV